MKKIPLLFTLLIVVYGGALRAAPQYRLGPDSHRQPGVPRGVVTHYKWTSKIFPGTVHDYWVYVPAEYNPAKPACVMVFQDGGMFVRRRGSARIPTVFDNLIYKHQMPVTIGIFIDPGILPALSRNQRARYDRSFEYDSLSGRYSRFLLDEILPQVGKHYNLSKDPNDRAIGGISSGGICALTVAWEHPEAFRRVLSFVGSFTDLRGGDIYPALIRKTEPKPLRIFLQDGTKDLNLYAGNWYLNAQAMASAFQYAGYAVKFVVGSEDHNMKQGGAILPQALRWLWRGYPSPITAPETSGDRQFSTLILDPGHKWKLVSQGHESTSSLAANSKGDVFFADPQSSRIFRITADHRVTVFRKNTSGARGLSFGPDGRLYACQASRKRILAYPVSGTGRVIAKGVSCHDLAVTHSGAIYFTDPLHQRVWRLGERGRERVVYDAAAEPASARIAPWALSLSPDQSLLVVDDREGKRVWSYQIQSDGSLANGEPFYGLETMDPAASLDAGGMTVDDQGYLYVATRLGLQICDQPGRVTAVLNKPASGRLSGVVFGGADFMTLYVTQGGKIFRRRVRRKGVTPGTLIKPPVPQL